MLLAQRLQVAGIGFTDARARHRGGVCVVEEFVAETQQDLDRWRAWVAEQPDVEVVVGAERVATAEEFLRARNRC